MRWKVVMIRKKPVSISPQQKCAESSFFFAYAQPGRYQRRASVIEIEKQRITRDDGGEDIS
jgi:hypothetical protein